MGFQSSREFKFREFQDSNLGVLGQNVGVGLMARHKKYYKGEGGGFPQVGAMVNLVSPCLPVVRPCTKSAPTTCCPTCCLVCASLCE
jgi:hypothetical protein